MPIAILLALAIHESKFMFFRPLVQTVTYLSHFLSWVIMLGLLLGLLSPSNGMINEGVKAVGGRVCACARADARPDDR